MLSTHRNALHALLSWELDAKVLMTFKGIEPPPDDLNQASLLAVPLFHVTGLHAIALSSFRTGRRLICMYKWDTAEAARLIDKEKITHFTGPSAMTGDLMEYVRNNSDLKIDSLLQVGGGGAPRTPEQVLGIDEVFPVAKPGTGWGMTETNAIGTVINGEDYVDRPTSSGRCSPVLELKVIDEDGNELPNGKRGELLVRGTSVFVEYWQRPEANKETFLPGGWMRTGDMAYIDEEGFVYIVDRIKDLIIRGGENIGCGRVENAISEHPDVVEVSVYGVPDERLGEEIEATVYATRPISEQVLKEHCQEHLAGFEVPRFWQFSDAPLPRTATGKILKRELRDQAVERLKNTGNQTP